MMDSNNSNDFDIETHPPSLLSPPNEEEYTSLERAELAVKEHAMCCGYGLSRKKLVKDKSKTNPQIRRRDLRCDKGGEKRGEGVKRQTGTRMTGCPFEIRLHRTEYRTWQVKVYNPNHNHPPSESAAQHAQYRRPNNAQKALIHSLTASGVAPRFVVAALLEKDPESLVSTTEVYNEVARIKKVRLNGLTPIEALVMELLNDDDWAVWYTTDDIGHVNFLFFTHDEAIDLAQENPDVILIDATYRTNRYNMPLLHFMTVTAVGRTTSIALCFLPAENETTYRKAIHAFKDLVMGDIKVEAFLTDDETALKTALSSIFPGVPQLLCLWHVNQNLKTKAQKLWKVNTTSDEENKANEKKRQDVMDDFTKVFISGLWSRRVASFETC
jgi:MULE transposase domain/FAR1 DNA-binding domain